MVSLTSPFVMGWPIGVVDVAVGCCRSPGPEQLAVMAKITSSAAARVLLTFRTISFIAISFLPASWFGA